MYLKTKWYGTNLQMYYTKLQIVLHKNINQYYTRIQTKLCVSILVHSLFSNISARRQHAYIYACLLHSYSIHPRYHLLLANQCKCCIAFVIIGHLPFALLQAADSCSNSESLPCCRGLLCTDLCMFMLQ